jgi:ribosomal protein RSM22 (predicted rRNA methylase)
VLRELEDPVGSVLDLGAGTGAGAWAIQESFSTAVSETSGTDWPVGDGLEVVLLEQNPDLIALSQRISTPATSWHPGNMLNLSGFAPADLILMSYSLGELGPRDRILALHSAWSLARKYLAVIEPGTPTGFSTILAARDHLLAQGASITAPCPHPSACPMTPPDWCHFAVRVGRTRLHKLLKEGDLGYEDEKFSYVLAAKPDASLARAADARILRHPTVYPGLVSLTLCDRQGIRPVEVRAKDKTTFKAARKASWGSRWAFPK